RHGQPPLPTTQPHCTQRIGELRGDHSLPGKEGSPGTLHPGNRRVAGQGKRSRRRRPTRAPATPATTSPTHRGGPFMDKWIVKLFGMDRFNFFGWLLAGLVVLVGSLVMFGLAFAFAVKTELRAELFMLCAIYLVLVGIFGILLSAYSAWYAEKLSQPVGSLS